MPSAASRIESGWNELYCDLRSSISTRAPAVSSSAGVGIHVPSAKTE